MITTLYQLWYRWRYMAEIIILGLFQVGICDILTLSDVYISTPRKLWWGPWCCGYTASLSRRGWVSTPHRYSGFQRNKMVFPRRPLVKIQYCGEHPWPRGSVPYLGPRISSPVSGDDFTISRKFSWPSLACISVMAHCLLPKACPLRCAPMNQ